MIVSIIITTIILSITYRIRLNNLDEKSDVHELGVKIIENCKLISPAQLPEIEYYLKYLAKRKPPKSRKGMRLKI